MFETGSEPYKARRQLAHFRKFKNVMKGTAEFENLDNGLKSRLRALIELLQENETLLIASTYLDNWLVLSSRRIFYGTADRCLFAVPYSEVDDFGWYVGDEIFHDPDSDGRRITVSILKPMNEGSSKPPE